MSTEWGGGYRPFGGGGSMPPRNDDDHDDGIMGIITGIFIVLAVLALIGGAGWLVWSMIHGLTSNLSGP
jgi:hypothetical protein